MFERFTDRARRVVVFAQEEARLLNHNYIGTEHILLGLVHEGEGVGAMALKALGISLDDVREEVERLTSKGTEALKAHVPFTPRAKKVLELSLREALQLAHNYIGTEHILLGLVQEGGGIGAQVLVTSGADLHTVRQKVLELLAGHSGLEDRPGTSSWVDRPITGPRCRACRDDLSETAAYRILEVAEHEGDEKRDLLVVFCRRCGATAGLISGP
jgi:ATP-dependent Clp protease ATP-binding subunit ClpA